MKLDVHAGLWPTDHQVLLLKACLRPGDEGVAAFLEWEGGEGIDLVDAASFRMLPLLYRNLSAAGLAHPEMATLKGIYRRAWYENTVLFHRTATDIAELQRAGLDTIVLKGLPLALAHYKDPGARPMNDADVLVPEAGLARAFSVLEREGWERRTWMPRKLTPAYLRFRHAVCLADPSGREIDLHWHVLYNNCSPGVDKEFWEASVPLEFNGVTTRTLNPADQLMTVCVHGHAYHDICPQMRWIADAITLMRAEPDLHWKRLVRLSHRLRISWHLGQALQYLVNTMDAPVPPEVVRDLTRSPVANGESIEYRRLTDPYSFVSAPDRLRALFSDHRRGAGSDSVPRSLLGFPRFLQYHYQQPGMWKLLGTLARRGTGVSPAN